MDRFAVGFGDGGGGFKRADERAADDAVDVVGAQGLADGGGLAQALGVEGVVAAALHAFLNVPVGLAVADEDEGAWGEGHYFTSVTSQPDLVGLKR